ncbi:hypothetical protein DFP73DRAFT_550750, partial [Morchella snyderi]
MHRLADSTSILLAILTSFLTERVENSTETAAFGIVNALGTNCVPELGALCTCLQHASRPFGLQIGTDIFRALRWMHELFMQTSCSRQLHLTPLTTALRGSSIVLDRI